MEESKQDQVYIITEASGRTLIGLLQITDTEFVELLNPLMFAEHKAPDANGGLVVTPMFMPLMMSEHINAIMVKPSSFYILPTDSSVARLYTSEWERYSVTTKAASAGIEIVSRLPNGR